MIELIDTWTCYQINHHKPHWITTLHTIPICEPPHHTPSEFQEGFSTEGSRFMSFQCVEGLHITVATSWGIPALTEASPLCFLALTVKISMTKNPYAKSQRERELSESASSKKAPQNRQISFVSIETTKMLLIIFPRFFLLCHICHILRINP